MSAKTMTDAEVANIVKLIETGEKVSIKITVKWYVRLAYRLGIIDEI